MAHGTTAGQGVGGDGSIIIGTSVDVHGMQEGLSKIELSFRKLQRTMGRVLSITAFVKLGKSALDAASNLQEVQNIVDVTFGDMAYKIESFSKTAITQFGMSELQAKKTAGSYMAMANAMGFLSDEASDMSVYLTGLTGDFASFYNISQEYARVALSAVFTGETETLKRYGIILTEANLQQYANTQGIETSVKKMDARNKAALRYNYILSVLNKKNSEGEAVAGDFERTQNNWANQTRLLTQNWTLFLNVLGSGLIQVLTPVLHWINLMIQALTRFAQVIGAALSNIFNLGKAKDVTQGIADSASAAAEAEDELADATTGSGKAAKKALAPWDDLNVLQKDTSSGAGSSAADMSDIELQTPDMDFSDWVDNVFSNIDTLYDLGRYIADTIEASLRSINWESIYEGARNFGTGLAEFLNGLITPGLFGAVGMTIASALNTAIYTALAFGTTFDWANLGDSLAESVNEFFDTFDFAALADAIDAWVQGIYTMVTTFLKEVEWSDVWDGIKEFISHIDLDTVEIVLGALTLKSIGKLIFAFDFKKWFVSGAVGFFKDIAEAIWLGVSGQIVAIAGEGAGMAEAFTAVFGTMGPFIQAVAGIGGVIGGLILSVKNFFDMWKEGFSWLNEAFMVLGIAIAAIGAIILGVPVAIAAAVAAIVAVIATLAIVIHDHWDEICTFIQEKWESVKTWFGETLENIKQWFADVKNKIIEIWKTVSDWFNTNVITPLKNFFSPFITWLEQVFRLVWIIIKAVWIVVSSWFNTNIITPLVSLFTYLKEKITTFFKTAWEVVKTVWNVVSSWFNETVIIPVVDFFQGLWEAVVDIFTTLWDTISTNWSIVAGWFYDTVIAPLIEYFNGLWDSITSGVKTAINFAIGIIEGFINGVIDAINWFTSKLSAAAEVASKITGDDYSGIMQIEHVSLPRLAKGAVIPPNKAFAAILGDQKSGTNIETPLDTMIQAFKTALTENGGGFGNRDIILNIDGRQFARVTVPYAVNELNRSGYNVRALER